MLIRVSGRCRGLVVDNAVVAGNIAFTAGIFTHAVLRCHLTPQQQDKADEERRANNRWRSQRREILHQGGLLTCGLTYRRLPSAVRCGAPPRMCLTQVLKMFVLLSYEVRSGGPAISPRHTGRCRYPARLWATGSARPAPRGPPAEIHGAGHDGRPACPEVPAMGGADRALPHHCLARRRPAPPRGHPRPGSPHRSRAPEAARTSGFCPGHHA